MKTTTIGILKADGTSELKTVPVANGSCLPALQEAVGGYIETVFLPHFKGQVYCNEEGLFSLPLSAWSSRIAYPGLHGDLVVYFSGRAVTQVDLDKLTNPTQAQRARMAQITGWAN